MDLIQDKVQVLPADLRTDHNHPEEVGFFSKRLVACHHAACLHHSLFHHWGHLEEQGRNCSDFLLHINVPKAGSSVWEGHTFLVYHNRIHAFAKLKLNNLFMSALEYIKITLCSDELLTVWSFFQSSGLSGRFLRLGGRYQKQTFANSGCREKQFK